MKLSHRLRAFWIKRSANALMKRINRAYENRPHVQSHHMIGEPVLHDHSNYEITARYVLFLLALCFVLGLINGAREEAPSHSCTPTKAEMRRFT